MLSLCPNQPCMGSLCDCKSVSRKNLFCNI